MVEGQRMRGHHVRKTLLAASAVLLVGIGTAVAQPPPPAAPPPPRYEAVPPPRGQRFAWEPGHWHWNGMRYVWIAGHYVERRAGWSHYVEGHWVWRPAMRRWEWMPGHWE
jgi:hypothetical protein